MNRKKFLAKHTEAEARAEWLSFQADAWSGGGGFAPIYTPQTEYNTGAEPAIRDHRLQSGSYLAKHEREEAVDYAARISVARYPNHVRHMCRLWLGLLLRREPTVTGETADDETIKRFLDDCDGRGKTLAQMRRQVAGYGLLYSMAPVLLNRPADEGARTAADSRGGVWASLLHPSTLWDWDSDDDGLLWVKIVDKVDRRVTPWDDTRPVLRARVWTRETAETWYADEDRSDKEPWQDPDRGPPSVTHGLGAVPVAILHYDDPEPGALFGYTPADELGQIGREDFNDLSRLTELHEKTAFPTWVVPCEVGAAKRTMSELRIGPAFAVPVDKDSSQGYNILAPPDGPVSAHERKRAANRDEAIRLLGMETLLNSSAAATSALARQYETEHRNAELARYAYRCAEWERTVVSIVLRYNGKRGSALREAVRGYSVEYPDDYGVQDRQADVALAGMISDLPGLDPWSRTALIRQVRDTTIQLSEADRAASDKWLDDQLAAMTTRDEQVPTEKILTPSAASGVVTVEDDGGEPEGGTVVPADEE